MMTEEISDVLMLFACGVVGLLVLLVWLAVGYGLAILVGRAVRNRDRQVPVDWELPEPETREMAIIRSLPTDTVEMSAVRR